ncbi:unnamed protein product [Periconia digitata]|uniref:TauD/TfdA-like domain-containing protein n=1 Tax=Periconia digitata TaxID=1303443 RepID=A0A9W4UMN2_9PLEO|nr:unnamed protein product [Periconia digitata]
MVLIQHHRPSRAISNPQSQYPSLPDSFLQSTPHIHLTPHHGTFISDIQIATLSDQQLTALARLVSIRGVVFLRDQDLTLEEQSRISNRVSTGLVTGTRKSSVSHSDNISQINGGNGDDEEEEEEWHTDELPTQDSHSTTSTYTLFHANETENANAMTSWMSLYGLYASLSKPMQVLFDSLHVVDPASKQQYPAVATHSTTGVKALRCAVPPRSGATWKFKELSKKEGEYLSNFLSQHLESSHADTQQWTWRANDVAVWDNRVVAYRHLIPSSIILSPTTVSSVVQGTKTISVYSKLSSAAPNHTTIVAASKARYNNTPSRRIINNQLSFQHRPASNISLNTSLPDHFTRQDSMSPSSPEPEVKSEETNDIRLVLSEKKKSAGLSNSPLRRIVERQVPTLSASSDKAAQGRRLDVARWRSGGGRTVVGVYS